MLRKEGVLVSVRGEDSLTSMYIRAKKEEPVYSLARGWEKRECSPQCEEPKTLSQKSEGMAVFHALKERDGRRDSPGSQRVQTRGRKILALRRDKEGNPGSQTGKQIVGRQS